MHSELVNSNLLKTKQHFEILDGLRGLAAVVVVIFHFMEIIQPDFNNNFIAHGYLAVDFFFCLSGFVIAYAYDNRIKEMGIIPFFKLRLIRLQPLVIIGTVIGILSFCLNPFSDVSSHYSFGESLLFFITSVLMIPYPVMPELFFNNFPLNPPSWSLFWEYMANILYVLILFKLRHRILLFLTFLAAITLCYCAYQDTNLLGGWGGETFWTGGARIFFSFLAGMLVFRSKWIIQNSLGLAPMAILLMIGFLVPFVDGFNHVIDPIIVILYFPFLVALGAGAKPGKKSLKLCRFSGEISYPLYMVHYPFIWIFLGYMEATKPSLDQMAIITCVGTVLLIGFAYVVMELLDKPIRKYLKNRMKREGIKKEPLAE
ncbi:acyltransferase [Echinicola sp. 20G]|uniref:acyltransferase family protein n=1 Tax=Echinicola sp. 20G TaxID=2781961 RepID=UPI00190FDF28|nr:acyltransferase [Echinicola sp. 20G]